MRFVAGAVRSLRRIESGELRQVDRARIAQTGDHFLREVMLDLLGLEFADEPAQQLAVLVAFVAFDLDGREHVAVALGDGEMQAKLGRDEMLELFSNGPDQRPVRAQVLGVVRHPAALRPERTHARFGSVGSQRARAPHRRRVRLRLDAGPVGAHSIRFPQHPALEFHDLSSLPDRRRVSASYNRR